jgi:hypothetical protein
VLKGKETVINQWSGVFLGIVKVDPKNTALFTELILGFREPKLRLNIHRKKLTYQGLGSLYNN